jgi:hypothetical protein
VNETRERKISIRECSCDCPHVRPDRRLPRSVGLFSLKNYAAAVGERLEHVLRRVLVDAHRRLTALLKPRERGI